MLKTLMPVNVYSISVLFKKESFKNGTMANMLSISFDVAIAAYPRSNSAPERFSYNLWLLRLRPHAFFLSRFCSIQRESRLTLSPHSITLCPAVLCSYQFCD
ncbi:hypothetical protein AHAS_Ahas09G0121800 [Arachis hypogaea]